MEKKEPIKLEPIITENRGMTYSCIFKDAKVEWYGNKDKKGEQIKLQKKK